MRRVCRRVIMVHRQPNIQEPSDNVHVSACSGISRHNSRDMVAAGADKLFFLGTRRPLIMSAGKEREVT